MSDVATDEQTVSDEIQNRSKQLELVTDQYFRGEIELDEFLRQEQELAPNWEGAFRFIASRRHAMDPESDRLLAQKAKVRLRDVLRFWRTDSPSKQLHALHVRG